jgi:signal peptidase II
VSLSVFVAVAAGTLLADLLTKYWVFDWLEARRSVALMPGLNFHLVHNMGALFGMGQGMKTFFAAFALVAAVGITWAAATMGRRSKLVNVGLGLLLGGAVGNLYDRIFHPGVRDFIDMYIGDWHWYTYNIADVAICAGAAAIVLHSLITPDPKTQAPKP